MQNQNSAKRYFGTDGIRGVYGEDLTDGLAMLVGNSLGHSAKGGLVVVGRDNRTSGENLSRALGEGVLAASGNVLDVGIVPTPCVAYVTANTGAAFGVMLSASHNPARYNGIKIFGADGKKLGREQEITIEKHISEAKLCYAHTRGNVLPVAGAIDCYGEMLRSVGRLDGLKIVLDCANGAATDFAPTVFSSLGADVVTTGNSRDGNLINDGCGALHPEKLCREVVRNNADMGLCFDGDADRVIACDEKGNVVNGDQIIFILARALKTADALPFSTVVGTLHTNMGVEADLKNLGIDLVRTDIGDHNVIRRMCDAGLSLGGEQSGHIILRDFSQTGDGILAGAFLARKVKESGKPLSALNDCNLYPQSNTEIITCNKEKIARDKTLLRYVETVEDMLGDSGRVMLRPSGTESKLRIMAESKDDFLARFAARSIELFIRNNYELN